MTETEKPIADTESARDALYERVAGDFAGAIRRTARAYEADAEKARDLEQDMHLELWRSLSGFRGDCAISTWVWRVAHNVGGRHVAREKRTSLVALDELAEPSVPAGQIETIDKAQALERIEALLRELKLPDRQVALLWLEGVQSAEIAQVTGLSSSNVGVKIHRMKARMRSHFAKGEIA